MDRDWIDAHVVESEVDDQLPSCRDTIWEREAQSHDRHTPPTLAEPEKTDGPEGEGGKETVEDNEESGGVREGNWGGKVNWGIWNQKIC